MKASPIPFYVLRMLMLQFPVPYFRHPSIQNFLVAIRNIGEGNPRRAKRLKIDDPALSFESFAVVEDLNSYSRSYRSRRPRDELASI